MREVDLVKLVDRIIGIRSELPEVEVKAAKQGCPKLFDSLSSLSNKSGGGVILFGIDEKEDFQLCGVYDAADLQVKVVNQCDQMEPVLRPLFTVTKIQNKLIVSAEIQEVEYEKKPCFYRGVGRIKGSYIRVGEADKLMTEYEIYSYEAFRKKSQDELEKCQRAALEDFSKKQLNRYLERLREQSPRLSELTAEQIMRLQGIVLDGQPTLAGIIALGEYPQAFYPQLCITAVVVPGRQMGDVSDSGERFTDNMRIEGNIPDMLMLANQFIKRNMSVSTKIDERTGERTDTTTYPMVAIREILLNSLIHRDYSIHTQFAPIALQMYEDRLVLENPGGLYGRLTLDNLGKVSTDTRNPFVARIIETLGLTENRFSGIPTIRKAMAASGLPEPVFESVRGGFRVTLFNRHWSDGQAHQEFLGESLAVYSKNSSQYSQQQETFPRQDTLLPISERIIRFCAQPRTRKELEKEFGSEITIAYLMGRYVQPLIKDGIIRLAIPDKPKSKNQRYYTVTNPRS